MDLRLLSELLVLRSRWKRRNSWSPTEIRSHQEKALQDLRQATYAGSEFYRQHHAGKFDAPLSQLPPVTKADLMNHFDDALTVPELRLAEVEEHLRNLVTDGTDPGLPWLGRWWVSATAGTTGRRGIFIWNRHEWATILASYARANDWAGIAAGLTRPLRVAVVSSRTPTHQSAVVGASLQSRIVPTLRLDATIPLAEIVDELNAFKPRLLVGYASALKPLAAEQRAGRLRISPQSVISASEVLSPQVAADLRKAWGSAPIDVYAATETAGIASPCVFHNRHIYEDLVIVESVDQAGLPVPAGTIGARILVTVLFSRTLPLIRYEMSDSVAIDGRGCPCGRSFAILAGIEGRVEDVLTLPATTGTVNVHPNVFHNVLDDATIAGWQVVEEATFLRVFLAGLAPDVSLDGVRADISAALKSAGATKTEVDVQVVAAVERTALGKAPLVRRWTGRT